VRESITPPRRRETETPLRNSSRQRIGDTPKLRLNAAER